MKTLKIPTIDNNGEVSGESPVPAAVFDIEASKALVSQSVLRFLSNQRKARAKAKTRSEVTGTGAKIWRQKGTGRARHGDRQAPIFVGGGVSHGPTGEQNYKKKMNQEMARRAVFAVMSEKLKSHRVFLLDRPEFKKTKEASSFLEKLKEKLKVRGKTAFLLADNKEMKRCMNNLKEVSLINVKSIDPVSLLRTHFLFLTKEALEELGKKVAGARKENNVSKS